METVLGFGSTTESLRTSPVVVVIATTTISKVKGQHTHDIMLSRTGDSNFDLSSHKSVLTWYQNLADSGEIYDVIVMS